MKLRRTFKILIRTSALLLLLLALLLLVLNLPATQRWLTPKLENWLALKLKTEIHIQSIGIKFPKSLEIKGLGLRTPSGDSLLDMGSLVVDMDMMALFEQKIVLQKISLENASAKLRHENAGYNFDFLLAAFASPTSAEKSPAADTLGGFQFVLDASLLELENVALDWQDVDNQQYISSKIGYLKLSVEAADLKKLRFKLGSLAIADTDIDYRDLSLTKPDTTDSPTIFDFLVNEANFQNTRFKYETSDLQLNTLLNTADFKEFALKSEAGKGIAIHSNTAKLDESAFGMRQKPSQATQGKFNASDMELTALHADLAGFDFQDGVVKLSINQLTGTDKSGLELQKLSGEIAYSPVELNLQNLDLQANKTILKGDAKFQFDPSGKTPLRFFEAKLGRSQGQINDILRFLPNDPSFADFERMANEEWSVEGNLSGNLNEFTTKNLDLRIGENTYLRCTGELRQVNDLNKLGGKLNIAALQFDKDDFTPFLKNKNWMLPAYAKLSGNINGNAGSIKLDLAGSFGNLDSLAFAPVRSDTAYFDLAGTVQGLANAKSLRMDMDIQRLSAPGRQFASFIPKNITLPTQISAKGKLKGSLTELYTDLQILASRSETSSDLAVLGWVNSLDKPDSLNFDLAYSGTLTKQELAGYIPDSLLDQSFNLPKRFSVAGTAKGKPTDLATKLDLGLGEQGEIKVDAVLKNENYVAKINGKSLKINELAADSILPQLRLLNLTAELEGDGFEIGKTATVKLVGLVQSLDWEGNLFENLALEGDLVGEKFDLNIVSPDPKLHLTLAASGNLNGNKQAIEWRAKFDCLDLQALGFSDKTANACLEMTGSLAGFSLDTMDARLLLENIDLQYDTLRIKPEMVTLTASLHNDDNDVSIKSDWLNADLNGHFDLANLAQLVERFSQHYFKTKPSAPQASWQSSKDSLNFNLSLAPTDLLTSGIVPGLTDLEKLELSGSLNAADMRFEIRTNLPMANYEVWTVNGLDFMAKGDGAIANFELKIPTVEQEGAAFVSDLSITGNLDGKRANTLLTALDSLGKERYKVGLFADAESFKDGYTVHFSPSQVIDYQAWTLDDENSLSFTGKDVMIKKLHLNNGEQALKIDGKTTVLANGQRSLDFDAKLRQLQLDNFAALLVGSLNDLAGTLDGDLQLGGTVAAPKPQGNVALKGVAATVATTNVRYQLSDKELMVGRDGIDLTGLALTDPKGNKLNIKGLLRTTDWSGLTYDLAISSPRWLALNTTEKPGVEYYGKLYVTANGTVRGPLAEPNITMTASPLDGSLLHYIYDDAVSSANGNGVVVFVEKSSGKKPKPKIISKKYPFHLNLNLDLNDSLKLHVITDPGTGDNFEGTMEGRLSLEIFPDGKMNLSGKCEVKKGVYHYSYQQLVNRDFVIATEPASYLAWSGDPSNPDLSVTARYVVRTSPYPLLATGNYDLSGPEARNFQTFYLNFIVTGNAKRPELEIKLEYPESLDGFESLTNSGNTYIAERVNAVNQDQSMLYQQMFSLLISKSFLNETGNNNSSNNFVGTNINSFISNQFNALAGQYIKFVDVQLEVEEDATFGEDNQQIGTTNYNLHLQKSFLNNRLIFKVTGGAASDRSETDSQWRSTIENAYIEYLLTPNGKFKLRAFSEDGLEILGQNSSRNSGAGIVFTKEFKKGLKKKKK